jgi:hypothetical protein
MATKKSVFVLLYSVANWQHRVVLSPVASCMLLRWFANDPAATKNTQAREGQALITHDDHGMVAGGGDAIRHSAETSNAPSNGSMIPVMKVRQRWQANLQLTKPRLSKVALVDRRNSSCAPHFGHFADRFCNSTFPASAAIAHSPPARCPRQLIREGRPGLLKDAVNLTDVPGTNKTPSALCVDRGAGAS